MVFVYNAKHLKKLHQAVGQGFPSPFDISFGQGKFVVLTNARLIAAAPDLLQALHDVDAYLAPEGDEEDVYNYIRAIIKGAISKAQGA